MIQVISVWAWAPFAQSMTKPLEIYLLKLIMKAMHRCLFDIRARHQHVMVLTVNLDIFR